MREIIIPLLKVMENAAVATSPWIGRGNKIEADRAAVSAIRSGLNNIPMDAVVVIGEGEIDEAPMLYIGEEVGTGVGPKLDIAIDPLEGTSVAASGQGNSVNAIAVAPEASLLHAPDMYMEKIVVGPTAAGKIDVEAPLYKNMNSVAQAAGKSVADLTVAIQDRPRHKFIVRQVQDAGAKVAMFKDGDVLYSIGTAISGTGIDMLIGVGGSPEGVLAAVALKGLGGEIQARLLPNNEAEYKRCLRMGLQPSQPLRMDQLVKSDQCMFIATGITEGLLLKGIRKKKDHLAVTHSIVINGEEKHLSFIESHIYC